MKLQGLPSTSNHSEGIPECDTEEETKRRVTSEQGSSLSNRFQEIYFPHV